MDEHDWMAERFEEHRTHLRAVAYRMLGSRTEADDAVQESWIRLSRAGASGVENLGGWLTTVTARVCLDMLRSRRARREEPVGAEVPEPTVSHPEAAGPEQEVLLADSVGLALLVVLETLAPAERVAFVLHDTFGLPFGEIASITGRSPAAARQLASRGRRRIQGADPDADAAAGARLARQRRVTEAFIAAARGGNLEGLIAVLDPEVVLNSDATASPSGVPLTVHGAAAVAGGARAASARARYGSIALVNGAPGLIMAPRGRLLIALAFTFSGDKISQIDVVADPDRLAALDLAVID